MKNGEPDLEYIDCRKCKKTLHITILDQNEREKKKFKKKK